MPTPLISLIVPVYNTEQYLDECIASILAQQLDYRLVMRGQLPRLFCVKFHFFSC